jgi:ubiquitin-protein ligase
MYHSPRTRRLHNDFAALDRLRSESSVFRFSTQGDPPHQYSILFKGRGLWRDRGKIKVLDAHRVEIKLGTSYPRTIPEIRWVTPIYHPNISEIGMVCLGGYGTHWVPSVQLDELCTMLWDMARYHNYDNRSPYNRDAALWAANQTKYLFPVDERPLRDLRAALGRISLAPASETCKPASAVKSRGAEPSSGRTPPQSDPDTQVARVRQFIDALERRSRRSAGVPSETATILQFIERFGTIFGKRDAPRLNFLSSAAETPLVPGLTVEAIAQVDSSLAGGADAPEEVVLVEPETSAQTVPEPPSPAVDEIIFID